MQRRIPEGDLSDLGLIGEYISAVIHTLLINEI